MTLRRAIITGGTGFIGSRLAAILDARGVSAVAIGSADVDLTDRAQTFEWFRQQADGCDHLFHLAAVYKAGGWPVEHPATQFSANMSININVLDAWSAFCPKSRLTSVLSYCMYPPHSRPHLEAELWGSEPEEYLFAYAFAKKALLIGQRAYRVEYGLSSTSVVLPTVYGPGDSFEESSHVVGALIGKFVRGARDDRPEVEVWGTGDQVREYLHVDDAVDGILAAAVRSKEEVVNLGAGEARSVRELAEMVAEAADYKGSIRFNPGRFTGVAERVLDCTLARSAVMWSASIPLEKGLKEAVLWYRSQVSSDGAVASGQGT